MCAGEVLPPRPADPNAVGDAAWTDYLVMRRNVRGVHDERWWHVRGCGSWLTLRRDTATHRILANDSAPGGRE